MAGHKLEIGVAFGVYYGMRRSEIVGLRWESIDFNSNTFIIEHSVTVAQVDGHKQEVASNTVKSKSTHRTMPLVPRFKSKLLAIKAEQDRNRKHYGKSYNEESSQYVYVDHLGNRIRPAYLTAAFPKFMEKAGLRRIRFHDLRHSCASLLLAQGVSMKHIQEWLGHSRYSITADTYAHLDWISKLETAEAMTCWRKQP